MRKHLWIPPLDANASVRAEGFTTTLIILGIGTMESLKHWKNWPKIILIYVPHDYSIGTMTLDGQEWVMGCTCNRARLYENWIIANGPQIAKYLTKRAEELNRKATALKIG